MQPNNVSTTGISPRNLTDKELVHYSDRYARTDVGMPVEFQLELVKRFEDSLNRLI